MLYCKNCGQKVEDSDRFCEKCSARLDTPDAVMSVQQFAAEKLAGEFDPFTVKSTVDLVAYEVFGYRIMERLYTEFDSTVYTATHLADGVSETAYIRHIVFPSVQLYSRVLIDFSLDRHRTEAFFNEIAQLMINDVKEHMERCAQFDLPCIYENAADFYNDTEQAHHLFFQMKRALPLTQYIRRRNMSVRDCLEFITGLMNQLAVYHKHEVPYCALSDDNVFVDDQGQIYLGAKEVEIYRVQLPGVHGQTLYRELFQPADRAAGNAAMMDIYGTGVLLFRLLNGCRHPFVNVYAQNQAYSDIARAEEARKRMQMPQMPYCVQNNIGAAVVKACAPASSRYRSLDEFKRILENALNFLSAEEINRPAIDAQKLQEGKFPYDGRPAVVGPVEQPSVLEPVRTPDMVRVSREAERNTAESTDNKRRGVVILALVCLVLLVALVGTFLLQRVYGMEPVLHQNYYAVCTAHFGQQIHGGVEVCS